MALTPEEKIAGRRFRDEQQQALIDSFETDPPNYQAPNFLAHFRHECPGRRDISTAIELKEIYVNSPEYFVVKYSEGTVVALTAEEMRELEEADDTGYELRAHVEAGRIGFIYREGKCRASGCGHIARSKAGRIVDTHERPPVEGRVARKSN